MHVLNVTVTLNPYITEETTDRISLIIITVLNDFYDNSFTEWFHIYLHTYTVYRCQEHSMNNSNDGFSVCATCALQPHRTSVLPKNITQL
jgi:hypothetical protein